ncbi:PaaI family thioesterase [Mesorhizobium sp. J428]|uniref:PaaI family thioesterase n=1 Tax=Mesorhizobium sp. J428 TaxID=2898440 RepID=UPI002151E4A0|nr:PaaI family thioesterase [Mesorhizobium sp. J428]MCR5855828.1 PaaI family thioesterase [Mesorhizobium sp. J428]
MTTNAELEPGLLADGWEPIRPGAFITLIGPFYTRIVAGRPQYCFRVATKHDNTQGRPHGGMIMTFLDEALGWSAHIARPNDRFFTVGFDCQFVGGSVDGDLVVAETEVVSATSSLMFMRGDCKVGDRVIATASGIWKRVGGKSSPGG